MKRLLLLIVTITLTGCVRPGDHAVSSNCVWSEDENQSLDLGSLSDRRHLRFDAVTAEDMAIRWADQRFSHRREYDQQVAQCMETLFQGVAQHDGVDVAVGGIRTRLQASLRCDVRSKDEVRFAFTEVTPLAVFEFSDRLHLRSIRTDN